MLYSADRLLLPEAPIPVAGYLEVEGDRIVGAGAGRAPGPVDDILEGLVVPGFVDVHCHGGGGASFVTEDVEVARTAAATHRRHGTTTVVASLVSARIDDLRRQVLVLKELVDGGELAGVHLEGPWLAPEFKGAHALGLLADPDPAVVGELLEQCGGVIKMVTIAPELPGALETISVLARQGVVVALGHTDADFLTSREAIRAGARGATHLFNAMPPLRHRDPGPVLALWQDQRVVLELILDGVHLQPELAAFVMASAPSRVALVTDAMAAAGAADGDYLLGELPVEVRSGVARIAGSDTIAGSTLTLDRAVRVAVAAGVSLAEAVHAASAVPADYLGLADVGRLRSGGLADVVVMDEALEVTAVMWRGAWQPELG